MSNLEDRLAFQIRAAGLPTPAREYRFDAVRRWRFDFAWPAIKLAAEVEGGRWSQGRHQRPVQFGNDCEKYNSALLLHWRVLRFTDNMIASGMALDQIEEAMK